MRTVVSSELFQPDCPPDSFTPAVDFPQTGARRSRRSAPARIVFVGALILITLIPASTVVLTTYRIFSNPYQAVLAPPAIFRPYFLPLRYLGCAIPLLLIAVSMSFGAVSLFRFRLGPTSNRGREIGPWSRWTGAFGALAVFGFAIYIAVLIAVNDIRDAARFGQQGVPAGQLVWSIIGIGICLALVFGGISVFRSEAFRLGIRRYGALTLGIAAALTVSYGAIQFGSDDTAYLQTGFHGFAYDPHPTLDQPLEVACGDQSHCIVESLVGGTDLDPPVVGFAASSDGGRTWHAILTNSFGDPSALSCTGATCWGLFPNPTFTSTFIASINILPSGHPQITLRRTVSLPGADAGHYFGWSMCNSATHCASFALVNQEVHPVGPVTHIVADATDDAGLHWTSQEIATAASMSISPPDGWASAGPWCDIGGQCLAVGTAEVANCGILAPCEQQIVAFRSSDNGATWTQSEAMPPTPSSNGTLDVSCQAIPTCTASWTPTDGQSVVSTSVNLGATWQPFKALGTTGALEMHCSRPVHEGVGRRLVPEAQRHLSILR